ncbi:MAG TPA: hypothetical protein VK142_05095 [Bacillota bacterium]|nr:hypothetical protein [Bacillota bacterium]
MRKESDYKKHYRNVRRETNNPAILNDVVTNGVEQYPGHNEKMMGDKHFTQVQEVARDNIDGKKWQDMDD